MRDSVEREAANNCRHSAANASLARRTGSKPGRQVVEPPACSHNLLEHRAIFEASGNHIASRANIEAPVGGGTWLQGTGRTF